MDESSDVEASNISSPSFLNSPAITKSYIEHLTSVSSPVADEKSRDENLLPAQEKEVSSSQLSDNSDIPSPNPSSCQQNSSQLNSPDVPAGDKSSHTKQESSERRLSSRVKAKPTYFDASPVVEFSSQQNSPDVTKENQDQEDSSNTASSSQEVDDEVPFKKPTNLPLKRRASKTPLNVTVKKRAKNAQEDRPYLFEIVKSGKSALVGVINDWIESYNMDKNTAMVDMLQFFVQCSGCNAKVLPSMLEENSIMVIRHLTENFDEKTEDYPLVINKPEFKKFKSNFSMFIMQLITLGQHNLIYDDEFINVLVMWLLELSSSQVRAFRHTSTFAGLKIISALIEVAIKVEVELDNSQRQLDSEKEKDAAKRSRDKLEKLKSRKEELEQNKERLEDLMGHLFNSAFVSRYRDTRPEIRLICFKEIGIWLVKYSHLFLEGNLKYLGWSLYDKVGEVRLQVLKVLHELYTNENIIPQLVAFTDRFKNRLIDMTLDVDVDVAVQAIQVLSILYKYDVLDGEECNQIEQLVFCDQRKVAHAAGEFLTLHIKRLSLEQTPTKLKNGRKEEYTRQMNIRAIIDFFVRTEVHDHFAYLVDSLWQHTDLVKDWRTMTKMLLDANPIFELEDMEEGALIDMMASACKQATLGVMPPGRSLTKKLSYKEKEAIAKRRHEVSCHYMECLPGLIQKYKADVAKVRELVVIPQYFDLEVYAEKRLTNKLDSLLAHIEELVLKNADSELLLACAETYHTLGDHHLTIKQKIEVSLNKTLDVICERFKTAIAEEIPLENCDKESEAYFNLVTNLKKIEAFIRFHDLSDWNLYHEINSILTQSIQENVEEEVLILSLHIMNMIVLTSATKINPDDPDKASMKLIRRQQKLFINQCDGLLQNADTPIKIQVFNILSDFFILFSKQLLNKSPLLAQLVFEADNQLQVRMRDYIITHVLHTGGEELNEEEEEDDAKAEELHSKRTLLCGLCKLLSYRIFDIKLAAPIFAQFLRCYTDYSDIIKQLMGHSRENDIILFSKVLLFSLQQTYENLRNESEQGVINTRAKPFHEIKELAHKFALFLGVNIILDNPRKSAITLHKEGITYAFNEVDETTGVPTNLLFLEVLHEFTYRVTQIDRKPILAHLEEVGGEMLREVGEEWAPLHMYRKNMRGNQQVEADQADKQLEDEMILEKKTKKPPARKTPMRKETRKKLSMSKVGGVRTWLNKDTIEKVKNSPKVAKSILKRSKQIDEETTSNSDVDFQVDSPAKIKSPPARASPAKRKLKSPAKASPAARALAKAKCYKRASPAKKTSPVKASPAKTRGTPAKKSPVKRSPLVKASPKTKASPKVKASPGVKSSPAIKASPKTSARGESPAKRKTRGSVAAAPVRLSQAVFGSPSVQEDGDEEEEEDETETSSQLEESQEEVEGKEETSSQNSSSVSSPAMKNNKRRRSSYGQVKKFETRSSKRQRTSETTSPELSQE